MPRHKKPVALKKLQGTYRSDRDGNRAEHIINDIIPAANNISVPEEIKDEFVIHYFKEHINFLERLQLLQNADIPHLTQMYLILQQIREVNIKIESIKQKGILENLADYETLTRIMLKLVEKYDSFARTYYLTPLSRTRLTIDALNIEKLKSENPSITQKLLNKKRA